MKADVADAVLALLAFGVGLADPEQRLAVRPAGGVAELVLALQAEEAEHLVVEIARAPVVADAYDQMVDADDARHDGGRLLAALFAGRIGARIVTLSGSVWR